MDVHVHVGSQRSSRDTSPDRAKICRFNHKVKPPRKVQVVYYLSRNGLLEHPHFMEVSLLPNQPLRLKDVLDRLMALRGSGMPLQYSWSSKRNYKSGYVWYDLGLKDVIHPAEGGEYVLKGSELVEGCGGTKQGIHQQAEANYNYNYSYKYKQQKEKEKEKEKEREEERSGCSRGVGISTEEVAYDEGQSNGVGGGRSKKQCGEKVKRRDGDGSRYSLLLQLIACGSTGTELKGPRLSDAGTKEKEREKKALFWEEAETQMVNPQPEEKEYFSGSLVDSINANRVGEPLLKKSNSYNEQRRSKLGLEEVKPKVMEEEEEEEEEEGQEKRVGMKDKCIPLIKSPKQTSARR